MDISYYRYQISTARLSVQLTSLTSFPVFFSVSSISFGDNSEVTVIVRDSRLISSRRTLSETNMPPKSKKGNVKKRKLAEVDEASTSNETTAEGEGVEEKKAKEIPNAFESFINCPLSVPAKALLQQSASQRPTKPHRVIGYGRLVEYQGTEVEGEFDPNSKASPQERFGWSDRLTANYNRLLEDEETSNESERQALLSAIGRYMDVHAVTTTTEYRTIYIAHLMNHLIHYKNRIIKNKQRLEAAKAQDTLTEELVESLRDQGFVRPLALVLCPFKKDAYDVVMRLKKIIYGDDTKTEVWNSHRFETEFTGGAKDLSGKIDMPEDHRELLTGNNDDCFRMGIAISKKTLKLFEPFHASDILLCSPLGLRMILNGDEGKEDHLLSSMQLVVIDRADIMLQQNWEHISLIFENLHSQPTKIDTDISRVRHLYLDGLASHYSQLLLFSRHQNELFWSLMLEKAKSYRGLLMHQPILKGTLEMIDVPCCQELHRFHVPAGGLQSDERFNYFKTLFGLLPEGTILVIPSYFDFVRVRNFLKTRNDSFVACHEYAPENKIIRARDMFIHARKNALLVTERFHFFNRRLLRGMKQLVFYQLPAHPLFYTEFINMWSREGETRLKTILLFTDTDHLRLQNVFGAQMAKSILASPRKIQAIVSE